PPRPAAPACARRRRKVLLAEDNVVNVEVACAMLESLGLDVNLAADGEQALQSVRDDDYDLVLMDCQMPVMDGFAATAEIRRHESQQGRAGAVPIIAITANALQGDREACLAAGMDDYLSKPFTQQALGQAIARWITLPRAATVHHDDGPDPHPDLGLELDSASDPNADRIAPAVPPASEPGPAPGPRTDAVTAPPIDTPPSAPAGTAPAPNRHHLNRRALDHIRALSADHGEALLERVLHAYVDDTPNQFRTLRLAIATRQPEHLRRAAHSLKSSSANVGAETLARLAKDLEQLGRDDRTDGAAAILSDMEYEFQAVRSALSAILEKET
ncbi:response regulator, partial [Rugamonas sp.]|uniref:response regulator n=1 Tax=Rugamonas sp. TaxID=1926287 RepID=UPI0025D8EED4